MKFMCEKHLDKTLLGRWIRSDKIFRCDCCEEYAIWAVV